MIMKIMNKNGSIEYDKIPSSRIWQRENRKKEC